MVEKVTHFYFYSTANVGRFSTDLRKVLLVNISSEWVPLCPQNGGLGPNPRNLRLTSCGSGAAAGVLDRDEFTAGWGGTTAQHGQLCYGEWASEHRENTM